MSPISLALAGKVAIVTGGASGIGRAATKLLAKAGATVAILDRDAEGSEVIANEVGGKFWTVDLGESQHLGPLVDDVLATFGRIDILVNVAGISERKIGFLDVSEAEWDAVYAINIKAPFILMQHVGRHMIARGSGGRIVNVSSSSAFRPRPSPPAYGSSKSALVQLSRSAAGSFGLHGINVNCVVPGITRTPGSIRDFGGEEQIQRAAKEGPLANLLNRVADPEDVAEIIVFLCLPASQQITAQTIHTSAGAVY